jgi:hypothetical protein
VKSVVKNISLLNRSIPTTAVRSAIGLLCATFLSVPVFAGTEDTTEKIEHTE